MICLQPNWMRGPKQPAFQRGEVHIWRASLDASALEGHCWSVLSADERAEAGRHVCPRERGHTIIAYGALRMVLARYLNQAPEQLTFFTDVAGRRCVEQVFTDYCFHLSQTDGLALIAIRRGHHVGIDVERVDDEIPYEQVAEHYFEPRELWDLRITQPSQRVPKFFDLWTRKTAESHVSDSLPGRVGSENPAILRVESIRPATGYAAAVAGIAEDWRLVCWDWHL